MRRFIFARMAMARSQPERQKGFWDLAATRIGVLSGAVGLVIAAVGLPGAIGRALGHESAAADVELAQKRAEAAAAGPRLEVRYLLLDRALAMDAGSSVDGAAKNAPATLVSSFPAVANSVLAELREGSGRSCRYQDFANLSVTYLELSNRGARDATDVVVTLDRLRLPGVVRIREGDARTGDYVSALRARATSVAPATVRVPRALGPGEGVRVPLFVGDSPVGRFDRWCVVSSNAFLPRTLTYADAALGTTARVAIRRMETPLVIAPGAVGRG